MPKNRVKKEKENQVPKWEQLDAVVVLTIDFQERERKEKIRQKSKLTRVHGAYVCIGN